MPAQAPSTSSRLSVLAEAAIREGLTTPEVLEEAQRRSQLSGQTVVRTMFEIAAVPEQSRLNFLHRYTGYEIVSLKEFTPGRDVAGLLSRDQCRKLRVVPLRYSEGQLVVAVDDPTDGRGLQALETQLGAKLRTVLAPLSEIEGCISRIPEHNDGKAADKDRSAMRLLSLGALAIIPFAIAYYLLFGTATGSELVTSLSLSPIEQKLIVVLGAVGWASVAYFLYDVLFVARGQR